MSVVYKLWVPSAALAALSLWASVGPRLAHAEGGYPDFYGTVLAADRERGTVTLLTDSDETITVDVRNLGRAPFDQGAFLVDNVVVLRTHEEGGGFVAFGWEQARNGREQFRGR